MKRHIRTAGLAVCALLVMGFAAFAFANVTTEPKMMGVVVSAKAASLEVADQPGASGSITIDALTVPGPSWIVVHLDEGGKPGMRVGLLPVPAGTSTDVVVPIEGGELTDKLIVALHADRGVPGEFDFNMDAFASSPDKPYFVDGVELAREVAVR